MRLELHEPEQECETLESWPHENTVRAIPKSTTCSLQLESHASKYGLDIFRGDLNKVKKRNDVLHHQMKIQILCPVENWDIYPHKSIILPLISHISLVGKFCHIGFGAVWQFVLSSQPAVATAWKVLLTHPKGSAHTLSFHVQHLLHNVLCWPAHSSGMCSQS